MKNLFWLLLCLFLGSLQPARAMFPLHDAIKNCDAQAVQALLASNSVDINALDSNGNTPLIIATVLGYQPIVSALLASGASLVVDDRNSRSPLFWAIATGNHSIARMLLCKGAPVNVKDDEGNTPLHAAFTNDDIFMARMLLDAGAYPHEKNFYNKTVVELAEMSKCQAMKRFVCAMGKMHEAAQCGDIEIIRYLLRNHANLNIRDKNGCTPLLLAILNKKAEMVKLLLMGGANLNCTSDPIMQTAVKLGSLELIEILYSAGASITDKNSDELSLLHLVARKGSAPIVNFFIKCCFGVTCFVLS